jgi:serine/threonine protein kinase
MSEHSGATLRRIFDHVMDAPREERPAILARECGGDEDLRRRIEAMIAGAEDEVFLNTAAPTSAEAPGTVNPFVDPERPGARIGPYRLLQQIGEGGFGRVFMAEQERPVKRRVALKIIKLGMDTRQIVARFEQERQALAILDHPHVAKVFDAGATDAGRPYFVMELCVGEPITAYCDKNRLSIRSRLEVFAQVCQAVQHAHVKGIIHRDLKPSNVLVSTQDGRAFAKVIDFGIAKATASKLTEKTLFTEHRQLIGTPEYMSPEQAEGSLDVDTRTDVYSLGVLLYELLTGSTPFDGRSLRSAAYGEIGRIIREVEPPRPSTRLQQSGDTIASVAARRDVEPKRLGTLVRGELDWIVMRAMDKDRGRRYGSVNALGEDVQRYLAGEAVVAAPPGRVYRARKFLRRNKGLAGAVTAVVLALSLGAAGFAWQAREAGRERDRALKAEAQTAERAAELQQVADFQSRMLSRVDPTAAGQHLTDDVRARFEAALAKTGLSPDERNAQIEAFRSLWSRVNAVDAALELIDSAILAPSLASLDGQFGDQPALNARLRDAIATRYLDIGLHGKALAAAEQVVEIRRRALGDDHPDTVAAVLVRCKALKLIGRPHEAETILRQLIERQRGRLGADDPLMLNATEYLAETLIAQNRATEAEPLLRQSLAGRTKVRGGDHQDTLMSMGNLSMALRGQGKFAEAESLTREVLSRRRATLGDENAFTLNSFNNLALLLLDQGRAQEAADLFRTTLEGQRRVLGESNHATVLTANNLAVTLSRLGRNEEAESIQHELLERCRRELGSDHPDTLMVLNNIVTTLTAAEKLAEAEPLCRESLERRLRVFGPASAEAVVANNVMSTLLRRQKKDAEAEPYLRAAMEASRSGPGRNDPLRVVILINLGMLTRDLGRPEEGERLLREAVELATRALGAEHPDTRTAVQRLSETYFRQKRFADVAELLSAAEPSFRSAAANEKDQGELRAILIGLGLARVKLGEFKLAEPNLKEAHALYLAARGPNAKGTQQAVQGLVDLYTGWHAADPTGGHDAQAEEWRARVIPTTRPTSAPATAPTTTPSTATTRAG